MPQLLAGFGAKGILLWRGVNLIHRRHFLWRGADGTQLPAYRFGRRGYCDYGVEVRRIAEPDTLFDARRVAEDLEKYLAAEAALDRDRADAPLRRGRPPGVGPGLLRGPPLPHGSERWRV